MLVSFYEYDAQPHNRALQIMCMPIAFEFQKILLFLEIIICPQPSREKGKPEEISEFSHNKTAYYTIILFSDSYIPLSPLIFFFSFLFLVIMYLIDFLL